MSSLARMMRGMWWTIPALLGAVAPASAQDGERLTGQPEPWGMFFQPAATEIMGQIAWFEVYSRGLLFLVTLTVLGLLIWVAVRYNRSKNPTPSRTSHNTLVEVIWTVVPVLILVAIAFPSFKLLYNQTTIPEPDLTVKAYGGQWYWNYEYMDDEHADIPLITSYMLDDDALAARKADYGLTDEDAPRLLAVDYPLVVPVGKVVHMLVTSNDVNHAVAVPSFGIKADAIQGRLNETWFRADAPGVYYGQCSELCGRSHAFMPLEVRVLSEERFEEWVALATEDLDTATEQLVVWQAEDREQAVAELAGG